MGTDIGIENGNENGSGFAIGFAAVQFGSVGLDSSGLVSGYGVWYVVVVDGVAVVLWVVLGVVWGLLGLTAIKCTAAKDKGHGRRCSTHDKSHPSSVQARVSFSGAQRQQQQQVKQSQQTQ